jgi:hypothetical protein
MTRKREYDLIEQEFKGQAYRTNDRIIRNHNNVGILILPIRLINKKFDVILIPKNDN